MIITEVILCQTSQVAFVDHDQMIEQFVAEGSNSSFCDSVLPRASIARPHGKNSARVQEIEHLGAKLRVAIEDEILVLRTFGERFPQLLYDPFTGGMLCAIEMDDLPAIMTDQEQAILNVEVCRHDREEIHPGDALMVILQECPPTLTCIAVPTQTRKISGDGPLRNMDPQFEQFALDSGCTPSGVFVRHRPDYGPNIAGCCRPSDRFAPGAKTPV